MTGAVIAAAVSATVMGVYVAYLVTVIAGHTAAALVVLKQIRTDLSPTYLCGEPVQDRASIHQCPHGQCIPAADD